MPVAVGLLKLVPNLDTAALLWTATVVRYRGHIGNHVDANTKSGQSTNRRFATRTRTLDFNIKILDSLFDGSATRHLGRDLRRKRRGLAGTLETLTTRGRPRQGIALTIGDRDDGVIERSVDVRYAVCYVFANLFADPLGRITGGSFCHSGLSIPVISSKMQRPCGGLCGCGHWSAYVDHAQAGHADDGIRGNNRCPSSV